MSSDIRDRSFWIVHMVMSWSYVVCTWLCLSICPQRRWQGWICILEVLWAERDMDDGKGWAKPPNTGPAAFLGGGLSNIILLPLTAALATTKELLCWPILTPAPPTFLSETSNYPDAAANPQPTCGPLPTGISTGVSVQLLSSNYMPTYKPLLRDLSLKSTCKELYFMWCSDSCGFLHVCKKCFVLIEDHFCVALKECALYFSLTQGWKFPVGGVLFPKRQVLTREM